jgi:hypothetical protein
MFRHTWARNFRPSRRVREPSTNVQFQPRLLFVYGVGITLQRHAGSPALLGSAFVLIGATTGTILERH